MEEMHLLPVPPGCKYALMALSMLNCIISLCDADEKIVNAMDELKDFMLKMYKNTLKQKPVESSFKKL
jgi:hypothetical protein